MVQQFETLGETTKQLEIALKYTNGDMEKAKSMVAKQFQDVEIVKAKYLSADNSFSGLFFAFFNMDKFYIAFIDFVQLKSSVVFEKVRIFDGWKVIYNDLLSFKSEPSVDEVVNLKDYLIDSFIECDLFAAIENKNLDELTRNLQNILLKFFSQEVKVLVEIEPSSSLELELEGIEFEQPQMEETNNDESLKSSDVDKDDSLEKEIEKDADHIIQGTLIVSPVKGKYLNDVAVGEKIMVRLTGGDPVTTKILTILKAKDEEGNVKPIKGRLKSKLPMEKGGYTLYVLVAKSVLVKILEEENVKVLMEQSMLEKDDTKTDTNLIVFIGAFVALVLFIGVILFALIG